MKWLIVFEKEKQDKAMSLLSVLQCEILKPIVGLDKENNIVSVNGPDNLIQLVDDLTKLVEPMKNMIEVWCDSKMEKMPMPKHSYPNQSLTEDYESEMMTPPPKHSYPKKER